MEQMEGEPGKAPAVLPFGPWNRSCLPREGWVEETFQDIQELEEPLGVWSRNWGMGHERVRLWLLGWERSAFECWTVECWEPLVLQEIQP
jgi:hypothetical protein